MGVSSRQGRTMDLFLGSILPRNFELNLVLNMRLTMSWRYIISPIIHVHGGEVKANGFMVLNDGDGGSSEVHRRRSVESG